MLPCWLSLLLTGGPGTACYRPGILEEKLRRNEPKTGLFRGLCGSGGLRALWLPAVCAERDINDTVLCAS